MLVHEATLNFQLVRYGDDEPLKNTKRMLAYFTTGVPDSDLESFWLLCMNPNHRPIFRQRMRTGPLVAAQIVPRDLFHVALLAEARAIACLRTDCGAGPIRPTIADGRLLYLIRETAKNLGIELVDYLITRLDGRDYYSWRELERG